MDAARLRQLFVFANDFKEGDLLVGGVTDEAIRDEAREALLAMRVGELRRVSFLEDGISDALDRSRDRRHDEDLDPLTIKRLKDILLAPDGPAFARAHRVSLPSEIIAAVIKVMTNEELSSVARRIFNPHPGSGTTIGSPQHFGSRIQPNSPGDDEEEILFSILEGLAYGCGDVILGINPAADDLDTIVRLEQLLERVVRQLDLPTRYCVLSDIVKQHRARDHAKVDVGFQSLAGTSKALAGMVGLDLEGVVDLARSFAGLYFETGQGSAVTNAAAEGVDMVTLEARAYGVARHIQQQTGAWMIVNDVAGFIGPEVFRTAGQLERACLEDVVMAKLHGVTMGLDVCATFHMGIPPATLHDITERVVQRAAPAYLMAVAGNADPMLGYLTTSFREHPRLRARSGREVTSSMQRRLAALGVPCAGGAPMGDGEVVARLYAAYAKAGGDQRSDTSLIDEGRRRVRELGERGFDLGHGCSADYAAPAWVEARLDAIYVNARRALYAAVDDRVVRDVCPTAVCVSTRAADRDDYLAHPSAGERLRAGDERAVASLYPVRRPQIQIVISDGLNANAVNEHLPTLLPPLRQSLADRGYEVGTTDIVVRNGRVRTGYHIGALLNPVIVIHFIGERPGTGLNTLSTYLTYGRDELGRSRWDPGLDHSCTTAICGIHPQGKPPGLAAAEIARTVTRMMQQCCSGVRLLDSRASH
ncbi:MAG: ethanolamine ammonia-lyase subunit EutB [Acidobacteria bacterium]|nr:ethanolamine ammonia-lyase subunit EutB [Acidobacteriota bacterium]